MGRYYGFLFRKRRIIRFSLFSLILVLMITLSLLLGMYSYSWQVEKYGFAYQKTFNTNLLYVYAFILLGLCAIEPILIFSFKMNRNLFEMERSLPVAKEDIYQARFRYGFLEIFLSYTFAYLVTLIVCLTSFQSWDKFGYFMMFYGIMLPSSLLVYAFFTFFFLRGRNLIDGIVLMLLAFLAVLLLGNAIASLVFNFIGHPLITIDYHYSPFALFEYPILLASDLMNSTSSIELYFYIPYGVSIAACIATYVGIIRCKADFMVEDANQKTVSIFGYKLLIPLAFIPGVMSKNVFGTPFYFGVIVLFFVFTYLAYALEFRRFRFEKKELAKVSMVLASELLIFIITIFI